MTKRVGATAIFTRSVASLMPSPCAEKELRDSLVAQMVVENQNSSGFSTIIQRLKEEFIAFPRQVACAHFIPPAFRSLGSRGRRYLSLSLCWRAGQVGWDGRVRGGPNRGVVYGGGRPCGAAQVTPSNRHPRQAINRHHVAAHHNDDESK